MSHTGTRRQGQPLRSTLGGAGTVRACAVVVIAEEASVQDAYDRPPGPFDEHRGGMGLALPLARRVIEIHGGRIWSPAAAADNDPLARGSAVISLPITE